MSLRRVVFSLDFELRWGLSDVLGEDISGYRRNLEGVEEVVPRLLELFSEHRVNGTWATVGALACESWDEYFTRAPPAPRYLDGKYTPSPRIPSLDPSGRLHFAPHLVRSIAQAPGQELASHSFSHFLFGEAGVTRRDAEADADAVARIFGEKIGVEPRSYVFPRNQVEFADALRARGYLAWRTNPATALWRLPTELREWAPARAWRFAESFIGVAPARLAQPHAVPASSLVRLNLSPFAFAAHCRALESAVTRVAEDEILHLWLHPHNLGDSPAERVGRLGTVFERLRAAVHGELEFVTMAEVARSRGWAGTARHE